MGILDDWDSMDVNFGPQSGSDAFGGGFSDDVLFGGSGGDRLKPEIHVSVTGAVGGIDNEFTFPGDGGVGA